MVLTRSFKETVRARAQRDPAFREALLREAIEAMLAGDLETGKIVLRDYINATIGFAALGEATGTSSKSLMRMFGPRGNPQAQNLFAVLDHLQKKANLRLRVRAARLSPKPTASRASAKPTSDRSNCDRGSRAVRA